MSLTAREGSLVRVGSLVINKRFKCYKPFLFDESLLAKGKSCTNERNKGYKHYFLNHFIFCQKKIFIDLNKVWLVLTLT